VAGSRAAQAAGAQRWLVKMINGAGVSCRPTADSPVRLL
jgi:hypothetical protein